MVSDRVTRRCSQCQEPLSSSARYCTRCGTPVADDAAEEIALSTSRQLSVGADSLNIRELMALVEAGVFRWRERLQIEDEMGRKRAAEHIKALSRILESLSEQLAQGRETVRITSRLPTQRAYERLCPLCGRGNRSNAKFCVTCGSPIPTAKPSAPPAPPKQRSLKIAARTDRGMVRANNEDTFYTGEFSTNEDVVATLLLVADGMGGAQAGEDASRIARETVKTALVEGMSNESLTNDSEWQALVRDAALKANLAVFQQARDNPNQHGMGTTLTFGIVCESRLHVAHIGDTRLYVVNPKGVNEQGAKWQLLTLDHSLVARLVDIGQLTPAEARVHPQRNILYRTLGNDPNVEVDTLSHALAQGDILVFCSDGLDSYLEDEEIAKIAMAAEPAVACERLIALANQRGGRDNITVVIAHVGSVA